MEDSKRFDRVMQLFPADYRAEHAEEIATTLLDAQDDLALRIGTRDAFSLAIAGIRIRIRSYWSRARHPEVESGLALGIRVALFAQGLVAVAFLWTAVIEGQSVWSGGNDYPVSNRVILAAMLTPWIVVYVAQLYARWRIALLFAAAGSVGASGLIYYKLVVSPFGVGGLTAVAAVTMVVGLSLVLLGKELRLGTVGHPVLGLVIWAVAAALYTVHVDGLMFLMSAPLAMGGGVFVLVSVGMAIAGKPRGLIACAMLAFPAWILGSGLFGSVFSGGWAAVLFRVLVPILMAAVISLSVLSIAIAVARRATVSSSR